MRDQRVVRWQRIAYLRQHVERWRYIPDGVWRNPLDDAQTLVVESAYPHGTLPPSEAEFDGELHDTRIGRFEDLSERRTVHRHDRRLQRSVVHRRTEPVERVERL